MAKAKTVPLEKVESLSQQEAARYDELKARLTVVGEEGLGIIKAIRDEKLYRVEFGTWENFCLERGYSEMNMNRLLQGYAVNQLLLENNLERVSTNTAEVLFKQPVEKQVEVVKTLMERNEAVTREAVEKAIYGKGKGKGKSKGKSKKTVFLVAFDRLGSKQWIVRVAKDAADEKSVVEHHRFTREDLAKRYADQLNAKKQESTEHESKGKSKSTEPVYAYIVANDDDGNLQILKKEIKDIEVGITIFETKEAALEAITPDEKEGEPVPPFRIEEDSGQWHLVDAEDDTMESFDTEAEAQAKCDELNAEGKPQAEEGKPQTEEPALSKPVGDQWWVTTPEGQLERDQETRLMNIISEDFCELLKRYDPHHDVVFKVIQGYINDHNGVSEDIDEDEPNLEERTRAMLEPRYKENGVIGFTIDELIVGLRGLPLNITGRREDTVRKILTKEGQTLESALIAFDKNNPKPKYDLAWD